MLKFLLKNRKLFTLFKIWVFLSDGVKEEFTSKICNGARELPHTSRSYKPLNTTVYKESKI